MKQELPSLSARRCVLASAIPLEKLRRWILWGLVFCGGPVPRVSARISSNKVVSLPACVQLGFASSAGTPFLTRRRRLSMPSAFARFCIPKVPSPSQVADTYSDTESVYLPNSETSIVPLPLSRREEMQIYSCLTRRSSTLVLSVFDFRASNCND